MKVFTLDIRTLSLLTVLLSGMYGAGLLVYNRFQRKFKGFGWLGAANLLVAGGFFLLAMRGYVSNALSVIAANTMIYCSLAASLKGITKFRRTNGVFLPYAYGVIPVLLILFLYYTYFAPAVNERIISISLFSALTCLFCTIELLRARPNHLRVPLLMTAAPFILYGLYMFFRGVWTITEKEMASFMSAGTVHGMAFLFINFLVLGSTFGYIWIAGRELEEELTIQASTDPLTGILNRRAIEQEAVKALKQAGRQGNAVSIIIFDLDHFKRLNDTFGHQAGDEVLVSTVVLCQARLRPYDIIGRYGGEEFVVVLPGADDEAALETAGRLRLAIEQASFEYSGKLLEVTASFGLAIFPREATSWWELVKKADQALYRAKENGRNRVEKAV